MSISFTNSTGNIFNIFGKCGLLVKQMRSYQNSQKTNLTDTSVGLVAQLNAQSDIQALVGGSYIGILNGASAAGALASTVARQEVNRAVFLDNPRIAQNLQSLQVVTSIQEVIRQMKLAGATVLSMTIGATPSSFTGTGNGIVVASTKRPLDGLVLENSYAENLLLTCTTDSYTGGATAGNETFKLTGTGAAGTVFDFNWPLGSNSQASLSAINGAKDNSAGNILTNSGFDKFTSNVPNKWTLVTGVAGTNIAQESTLVYDGTAALKIIGDGSNLTEIKQQFSSTAGTLGSLSPLKQYGFNIFIRRDAVAAGQGILTIQLADQNGTTINDANGVANSFTVDLTALGVNYASFTGVFRTPNILPTSQFLRIRLTTALTSGRAVYLDLGSMGLMTQAYTSGPFVSIHRGSTNFTKNDYATVNVTNSRGAAGTIDTFQTAFFRLFFPEVLNNEFLLPSNSSNPSIPDSLIS